MSTVQALGLMRGLLPVLDGYCGCRYPDTATRQLPGDSIQAARVPAGVHLAFAGSAPSVVLAFERGAELVLADPVASTDFVAFAGDRFVRTPFPESADSVEIHLPARADDETVRVYLPERIELRQISLAPVGGAITPATERLPRWVAYGDSITQGWSVARAENSWTRRTARRFGLELVNLGLAGSARGELPAALAVGESSADIVTVAWGTNAWSSLPTDAGQIRHTMRVFLTAVRQGLPEAPIVVISPVVRPAGEHTSNRFGSTLADLRAALEESVVEFAEGSLGGRVTLVPGLELLDPDDLVDGVHPGDEGHGTLAERLAPHLQTALQSLAGISAHV
jgi:lysophospholipase L1-like esterase